MIISVFVYWFALTELFAFTVPALKATASSKFGISSDTVPLRRLAEVESIEGNIKC